MRRRAARRSFPSGRSRGTPASSPPPARRRSSARAGTPRGACRSGPSRSSVIRPSASHALCRARCRGTASGCGTSPSRCPAATAHSTVRSNTIGSSPSMPNTKLPLTITPRSCRRRISRGVVAVAGSGTCAARQVGGVERLEARRTGCAARRRPPSPAGPGGSTELTVPAACHSRPMPRMPSKSAVGETLGCRTGGRRGSTGAGRAAARSRPARRRPSGCRTTCRPRRTRPCSRSRSRAGSRATPRSSSAPGTDGA